ncbi:MAG: FHA domain-containing protein [Alphaproteobacteria bacterium]|nr:FHA domain-containing protein [Alphaproteobacteria bacterium]
MDVGHGDLVGRLWHAAVQLDDPRISEAHALVSLRGGTLRLLGLRGRFAVGGRALADVALAPGLEVVLAEGLGFTVDAVILPDTVLGVETDGMPARVLPGTCALVDTPAPTLAPPSHPAARAWVWNAPTGWRLRARDGVAMPWEAGDAVEIAGRTWRAVAVPTGARGEVTRADPGVDAPLTVVARYDTVHLFRAGRDPLVLRGLQARLVSELAAMDAPVPWALLVEVLWPDGGTRKQLDMVMVRLRSRLREARVRTDLVRADGCGVIELFLRPGDVVEDQT